jgi:hypothetical protein
MATPLHRLDMPIIDRKVKYQGLSGLRKLDGKQLRELDDSMLVIQEHNSPLAVMLSDPDELSALLAGLKDVRSGRVESLEDIRKGLTNNKQKQ